MQEIKVGLPPMLYFPYIDVESSLLRSLLCWFQHAVILQPIFSATSSETEEAERLGMVTVSRPLSLNLDTKQARSLLREFERLGEIYQDSGYLVYLSRGGAMTLEEEPGYQLVRKIRQYGKESGAHKEEETLRGQLLLQMAQDFDRQRREIHETLGDLHQKERNLQWSLGVEREEDNDFFLDLSPLPHLEEDDFLLPQRLRAWLELYEAYGLNSAPYLLTDNSLVMEQILERIPSGEAPGGPPSYLELLRIPLPYFSSQGLDRVRRIREAFQGHLPWQIFSEKVGRFLKDARRCPWNPEMERDLLAAGRALSSYFAEEVREGLLARIHSLGLLEGWESWEERILTVVLFPGRSERTVLRAQQGQDEGRSAAIFHWDVATVSPSIRLSEEEPTEDGSSVDFH
jgi:hypothetical protein